MKFQFNTFNHNALGQMTLEGMVKVFMRQLMSLGHEVAYRNDGRFLIGPDAVNVLVEGFTRQTLDHVIAGYRVGARFLVIATEEPSEQGFSKGAIRDAAERQAIFPELKGYIEGILHLVPGAQVTAWYEKVAPAAHAELGYAPGLERFDWSVTPTHEIGFYGGGITGGEMDDETGTVNAYNRSGEQSRRMQMLLKLGQYVHQRVGPTPNAVRVITGYKMSTNDLEAVLRTCKVIVQIRMSRRLGLVSSSRCSTALLIGRGVIAEPHELSWPWSEVVHFAPTERRFYEDAVAATKTWRTLHAMQFEKFKRLFTPERCMGEPMRRIGLGQMRAAA